MIFSLTKLAILLTKLAILRFFPFKILKDDNYKKLTNIYILPQRLPSVVQVRLVALIVRCLDE